MKKPQSHAIEVFILLIITLEIYGRTSLIYKSRLQSLI